MELYAGDAVRELGMAQGDADSRHTKRGEEEEEMTHQELAHMPLESLLYYVLVGAGQRGS